MFPNVKLQRLCKPHNLQCITSSKDSEKLEKSLCERNMAEDLCWIPVAFGPSDDTASLIGMILSFAKWAQEYFHKPLSVDTIRRAICRCQRKLYHAKRKPYVNIVPSCPVGQGSFKMDCFKVKSVPWSDESRFDILVGNHGCCVLRASSVLSAFSSKASISDAMGVRKLIRYGHVACFERH